VLAGRRGGEALIIDPVLEKVDRYLQLIRELDLRLVKAVDTHLHADHVTGLGALRDRTHCITVMGEQSKADIVSMRLAEGDKLTVEGVSLDVIYTPGHTDDSYSYLMRDRVFSGDTLLIRGTGRTDFQNGDPRAQYDSIFNKLLRLPDDTLLFPAHDYKGETVSTIGEEKAFNPRLQVKSADEYAELMNNLKLPNPKMMDVAVPANMKVGLAQDEIAVGLLADGEKDEARLVLLRRPEAVDARHRRDDDDVAPRQQRERRRVAHAIDLFVDDRVLLDEGVGRRDVRLGLVVVVVADEELDRVLREQILELAVELPGQRLVVRDDQRGPLDLLDQVRHREGLAAAGHAEKRLVPVAAARSRDELLDGPGLVALGLVVGDQLERHGWRV